MVIKTDLGILHDNNRERKSTGNTRVQKPNNETMMKVEQKSNANEDTRYHEEHMCQDKTIVEKKTRPCRTTQIEDHRNTKKKAATFHIAI